MEGGTVVESTEGEGGTLWGAGGSRGTDNPGRDEEAVEGSHDRVTSALTKKKQ